MAQVKIYGLRSSLAERTTALSDAIHESLIECFGLPEQKRFHRFILLDEAEFRYPGDRSEHYTILELSVFEGRSTAAKKKLINTLFQKAADMAGIQPQDLEITIFETPMSNWGIRGRPADELALDYKVSIE